MRSNKRHNPAIAAVSAWWLSNIAGPVKAFYYGRAAQRDELNGFPYTAALEWRKAAELMPARTRTAEYAWLQWERIMHLPRRLSRPIGVSPTVFPEERASATRLAALGLDQMSLETAA